MGKVLKLYIIIKQSVIAIFSVTGMLLRQRLCFLYLLGSQRFLDFLMRQFNLNTMGIQLQLTIIMAKQLEPNKHCNRLINNNNKPLCKLLTINFRHDLVPNQLKYQVL